MHLCRVINKSKHHENIFKATLIVLFFSVLLANRMEIQNYLIDSYQSYVADLSSHTGSKVSYLGV